MKVILLEYLHTRWGVSFDTVEYRCQLAFGSDDLKVSRVDNSCAVLEGNYTKHVNYKGKASHNRPTPQRMFEVDS